LVAKGRIEARPIHPGRFRQIIERRRRIAGFPELIGGPGDRLLRVVGPGPAAPLRLVFLFFYPLPTKNLYAAPLMWEQYKNQTTKGEIAWSFISRRSPVRLPLAFRSTKPAPRPTSSRSIRRPSAS